MATNVRVDPKTKYRSPWIEGYASRTSVRPGESIALPRQHEPGLAVRRSTSTGWATTRATAAGIVLRLGPFPGKVQPDPPVGDMRLRECAWEPCATLTIPDDWTSGVYLGKLTAEREGLQSYVIFVVRDDRKADFLFQV